MIFCVWYPTGGFGHFINGILHTFRENFVRNDDQEFGQEVPHNDFPNFFASTAEINRWLQS
jgi:hypothetical protein